MFLNPMATSSAKTESLYIRSLIDVNLLPGYTTWRDGNKIVTIIGNERLFQPISLSQMRNLVKTDSELTSLGDSKRHLSTGLTLIRYSFGLQLVLHLITFGLNSLSYRYLDVASLGLVNVRLGLFYSTLVFVSREAFRLACTSCGGQLVYGQTTADDDVDGRDKKEDAKMLAMAFKYKWKCLMNLIWLALPLGIMLSIVLALVWIYLMPSPTDLTSNSVAVQHQYLMSLVVYTASVYLELSTESFWLVCQLAHMVRARICIEALANLTRAVGIVWAIYNWSADYAIYSIALPQIFHGLTLFLGYIFYFAFVLKQSNGEHQLELAKMCKIESLRDFFPNYLQYPVDRHGIKLARNFFGQILFKQLLTEGERYLISAFHLISFTDQAIYDLVCNLGSLAARLLFLPLEESCHFIFGQCLQRDAKPNEQNKHLLINIFRMFRTALRLSSLVAWIGLIFAQANSRLLFTIYVGPQFAENPTAIYLLRLYSAYVLLLAWNGSTEAFVTNSMSTNQVLWHNNNLFIFSILFLAANWILVPQLGVYGFVLANSVNMCARILYSLYYIKKYVKQIQEPSGLKNSEIERSRNRKIFGLKFSMLNLMFPSWSENFIFVLSLVGTLISEHFLCCNLGILSMGLHICITTVFLLTCIFVVYKQESDLIKTVKSGFLRQKAD